MLESISIHEGMANSIDWHDEKTPFAPENGKRLTFEIGDDVVFTNDYGCKFNLKVTGLFERSTSCKIDEVMYAYGYRHLVNSSCPWFPVKETSLSLKVQDNDATGIETSRGFFLHVP
jgi:hypothetical protein